MDRAVSEPIPSALQDITQRPTCNTKTNEYEEDSLHIGGDAGRSPHRHRFCR